MRRPAGSNHVSKPRLAFERVDKPGITKTKTAGMTSMLETRALTNQKFQNRLDLFDTIQCLVYE